MPILPSEFYLLVSQIGLNNSRGSLDFRGGALGNQLPMIKGYHAIRQARGNFKVVLDQQYSGFIAPADLRNVIGGLLLFFSRQTGDGFIQQEQSRFYGDGPADLTTFLNAVRTVGNPGLPLGLQVQKIDDFFHDLAMTQFLDAPPQTGVEGIFSEFDVSTQQQVVEDGHVEEKAQILKGAGDSPFCDEIRGEPHKALPFKRDLSAIRAVYPGYAIKQGRFAGTIGSDDRQDFLRNDVKINVSQGPNSPETYCQLLNFE